nr:ATP-dependent DNA helicase PIF1-like [Ipomoea batatas]
MNLIFSSAIATYRCFSSKAAAGKNRNLAQRAMSSKKDSSRNESSSSSSKPPNKRTRVKWTVQQSQVLDAISAGKSVFVTGSAGTGKTFLIQHIIRKLRRIYGRSRVYVTASTGVSACALNGYTLHSFAGIGLGEATAEELLHKVCSNQRACHRWKMVQALIIDEISLISGELFDKLEFIARKIRSSINGSDEEMVWGGIQVVASGDFFQLPPIFNKKTQKFAFEACSWNLSFDTQIDLTTVFRQSDPQLIKLLQGIRKGEYDFEDLNLLENHCSKLEPDSLAVKLYPRNDDVYIVNKKHLDSLHQDLIGYRAVDSGEDSWKQQLKLGIAPDFLELCVGARVMLTKNLDARHKLVNGATGTVIGFESVNGTDKTFGTNWLPIVKFDFQPEKLIIGPETWSIMDGEEVVAVRKQIPLILAWALSIHKCQGMTLDCLYTDLNRAFGYGMVYVALSRVKSLEGLHLSSFNPNMIKVHPKVLNFYNRLCSQLDQPKKDAVTKKRTKKQGGSSTCNQ